MTDELAVMLGKVMTSVTRSDDNRVLTFVSEDGTKYEFYHEQDCCEQVSIADVIGKLDNLVGSPILVAEEVHNPELTDEEKRWEEGSYTWTVYKFATVKGWVDVRWYGESNGYYSRTALVPQLSISHHATLPYRKASWHDVALAFEAGKHNQESTPCHWREDVDGVFETGCENAFFLDGGTPAEVGMKFCCYCGQPLKEMLYQEDER